MPHLNIENQDDFAHLIQLFLATHPQYQPIQEDLRAQTAMPAQYFLSLPMVEALVRWGRQKHFLTRRQGEGLLQTMRQLLAKPEHAITFVPCVLGDPPVQQRGVRASEVYGWIFCKKVDADETDYVLTIAMAIEVCHRTAKDPECAHKQHIQARARALAAWLDTQEPFYTEA